MGDFPPPARPIVRSATMPSSPSDGMEWLYPVDTANGANWLFRYNAGSSIAYKWEFCGGPPYSVFNTTDIGTQFTSSPFASPTLALPFKGIYAVKFGANLQLPSVNATASVLWNIQLGDTSAYAEPYVANTEFGISAQSNVGFCVSQGPLYKEFTTAVTLKIHWTVANFDTNARNRFIAVTPTCVGS